MSSVLSSLGQGALTASPQILAGYGQGQARAAQADRQTQERDRQLMMRRLLLMEQAARRQAEEEGRRLDREQRGKIAGDEARDREVARIEGVLFDQDKLSQIAETGQLPQVMARYRELTGRFPFGEQVPPPTPEMMRGQGPPVGAPPSGEIGALFASNRPPDDLTPQPRVPNIGPSRATQAQIAEREARTRNQGVQAEGRALENFFLAATLSPRIKEAFAKGDIAAARLIYEQERPKWEAARLELDALLAGSLINDRDVGRLLQKYNIDVDALTAEADRKSRERIADKAQEGADRRAAADRSLREKLHDQRLEHELKVAKGDVTGKLTDAEVAALKLAETQLFKTKTTRTVTGSRTEYFEPKEVREPALKRYLAILKRKGVDVDALVPDVSAILDGKPGAGAEAPAGTKARTFTEREIRFAESLVNQGQAAIDRTLAKTERDEDLKAAIAEVKRRRALKVKERPGARPR